MALHLDPAEHEPVRVEGTVRVADIQQEWRLARDGIERIAHGAVICPRCDAPLAIDAPMPAGEQMRCGYCGHVEQARGFLVRDVFDTVANEAYLIARLTA